jgi:Ca-activated chloride channel family protein
MTRRPASAVVAIAGAASLTASAAVAQTAPPAAQQPPPVFRASADVVSVEAAVRRDRRPVTGLTAADFELFDNGVPQQITSLSYEKLPIDVTVVLDVSASVTGSVLDELRRALRQLRSDLGPQDRLRLLTFNMSVRRLADFDAPSAAIDSALDSLAGGGSSAVFDSLAVALVSPVPAGRRQLIVLFSDGQDSSSISDADTLLDVAGRTAPTVAVVLSSPSRQRPAALLRTASTLGSATVGDLADRVANETGGFVTAVAPGDNLTSTFRRVLDQFRTSYVLYFTPTGVERQGAHTIEVRVKRAKVEVRSRRGYVWR